MVLFGAEKILIRILYMTKVSRFFVAPRWRAGQVGISKYNKIKYLQKNDFT
jgi:hypothetical protein